MTNLNQISEELDSFSVANSSLCSPDQCYQLLGKPGKFFNIIHVNIRSINKNFDQFVAFLGMLNFDADVLILSECWLKNAHHIPLLEGFTSYRTYSNKTQNDGVVVYARRDLDISVWEPSFMDGNCLVCTVDKKIALVCIYRSPANSKIVNFLHSLTNIMLRLENLQHVALVGDVNIDIKPNNKDNCSDQYLTSTASLGLLPAHTFPTRLENCLDHILLKSNLTFRAFVFLSPITDHQPSMLSIEHTSPPTDTQRISNRIDLEAIKTSLDSTDFSSVMSLQDANKATDQLISIIKDVIKTHTKVVVIPKKKNILKPWITPGLLRCMRNRDKMHKKLRKSPNNLILKITYKRYRNFLNNLLRKIKRDFYKNEFKKASNNPKAMWNVVKTVTNSTKQKDSPRALLETKLDPHVAVNSINEYFASVAQNLAAQITPPTLHNKTTTTAQKNSVFLLEVDFNDVERIIRGLRDNCAPGWDGITPHILKASKIALIPPVAHICNLSIRTGVFPNAMKIGMISPIYKQGDKGDPANYRPISVLPILSKVLERILNNCLVKFLVKYNIIAKNQFGFKPGVSTEDAIESFTSAAVDKLDRKKKCFGIFLDLSKAFDTVSIDILLTKLELNGIRGPVFNIFKSYLSDRKQCVRVESHTSDLLSTNYGVPQGSILGPTLFQLYVNDLCKLDIPNCSIYVYADDTALLVSGNDWQSANRYAQVALGTVTNWLSSNLLTLNIGKTQVLPLSITCATSAPLKDSVLTAHRCTIPSPSCDCPPLNVVKNVKYLGVTIDSNLKWHSQIEILKARTRKLIYIFKIIRHLAEPETVMTVYLALCQSILSYCIPIWGGAGSAVMLNLERAQRAILKIMTHKHIRHSTHQLYAECEVLTVRQLFVLRSILRKHASLPLDELVLTRRRSHSKTCPIVTCRTTFARRQHKALSVQLYNKMNNKLSIYTLNKYEVKNKCIGYLKKMSYSETEDLLR